MVFPHGLGRSAKVSVLAVMSGVSGATADTATITPAKDTSIFNNGETGNGAGAFLFAGQTGIRGGNTNTRSLLMFDLSGIPAGATVTAATLTLRVENAGTSATDTHTVHRMLADWGEGAASAFGGTGAPAQTNDATWSNRFSPGDPWTTSGGDFVVAASASTAIAFGNPTASFSGPGMVADVQAWLAAPASNFGWILRGVETRSQSARKFASKEVGVPTSVPTLTIQFTVTPICRADFNGTGGVTVQDIFDFLAAWFANDAAADFNGMSGVTIQDLFDFLAAYFTGC